MVFPVVMCWCEIWTIKKAEHRRIDAFELWCWRRLLKVCKEIKPVNHKGNQSWIFLGKTDAEAEASLIWPPDVKNWFIGRTDAKAETPALWPPHVKSWLIWKDPDAGKVWKQEEKGTTEHETVGWHHRLNGHEIEWTPGVGDGQGGLGCCSPWGRKELDTTGRVNKHNNKG